MLLGAETILLSLEDGRRLLWFIDFLPKAVWQQLERELDYPVLMKTIDKLRTAVEQPDRAEEAAYQETLEANQQVGDDPLPPGATHRRTKNKPARERFS